MTENSWFPPSLLGGTVHHIFIAERGVFGLIYIKMQPNNVHEHPIFPLSLPSEVFLASHTLPEPQGKLL